MFGFALFLAVSLNQDPDLEAEASCIPEALYAQADAHKPFNPEQPIKDCRQRYGWTDAETDMAVATAKAMGEALDDRQIAVKAGVAEQALDELFASLRGEDVAKLGYFGQQFTSSELGAHNDTRRAIGNLISARDFSPDGNLRAQLAIISRGILQNTVRAFKALRLKRG